MLRAIWGSGFTQFGILEFCVQDLGLGFRAGFKRGPDQVIILRLKHRALVAQENHEDSGVAEDVVYIRSYMEPTTPVEIPDIALVVELAPFKAHSLDPEPCIAPYLLVVSRK